MDFIYAALDKILKYANHRKNTTRQLSYIILAVLPFILLFFAAPSGHWQLKHIKFAEEDDRSSFSQKFLSQVKDNTAGKKYGNIFFTSKNYLQASVNSMRSDAEIFNLYLKNPLLFKNILPQNTVNSYDKYEILSADKYEVDLGEITSPVKITAYIVKPSDSLPSLASRFSLKESTIVCSNNLDGIDLVKPGMVLRIPDRDGIYIRVKKYDTLSLLAREYKSSAREIKIANSLKGVADLFVGRELFIPGGEPVAIAKTARGRRIIGRLFSNDFIHPLNGRVSSTFGWRTDPFTYDTAFHSGLDLKAPEGANIVASASGRVVYSGWMNGYGMTVIIRHFGGFETLYGHCSILLVGVGDHVKRGNLVARVGSTGRTTGPHLHFEIRRDNVAIDSSPLLWK